MKVSSPQHFLSLKEQGAIFSINWNHDYFNSRKLSKIESEWKNSWKLYFIDSYRDLSTWKQVEEIVHKDGLAVWALYEYAFYGSIPLVFWWKDLQANKMTKLLEKMRLVWEQISSLYQDFITWKSIKFDMWKGENILRNIYDFYNRTFLSRISTGIYKITENPISSDNTSLTDVLICFQKLDILDEEASMKLKSDLLFCNSVNGKSGEHSRNNIIAHMDYKAHKKLSIVNEEEKAIYITGVPIDNSWLDDIKKLNEIREYWLAYIFAIRYPPNISQPHNPQELNEYEYHLFLTVKDKKNWENILSAD